MSERGLVALRNDETGEYFGIYNHNMSYPKYLGYVLSRYYNTYEKVWELIQGGNASIIGSTVSAPKGKKHTFERPYVNPDGFYATVYYGRDRAEKNQEYQKFGVVDDVSKLPQLFKVRWCEYMYLFSNDRWYVGEIDVNEMLWKFQILTNEVIRKNELQEIDY